MNADMRTRCGFAMLLGCALFIAGCDNRGATKPRGVAGSPHAARVCTITAELLGVEPSAVTPHTTLAELGVDDLDFVEIIMALEEEFSISIPDSVAEEMLGTSDWQKGMKNVTMAEFADLVSERMDSDASADGKQASAN